MLGGVGLLVSDYFRRRGSGGEGPDRPEEQGVFVATEAEIALAQEEAVSLKELLMDEWPYITPTGTDIEEAIGDWRLKTTGFINTALGSAHRAGFRIAAPGWSDPVDRLEHEAKYLGGLAQKLSPGSIRFDEGGCLSARKARRQNGATKFFDYDHHRAPGAPPKE